MIHSLALQRHVCGLRVKNERDLLAVHVDALHRFMESREKMKEILAERTLPQEELSLELKDMQDSLGLCS